MIRAEELEGLEGSTPHTRARVGAKLKTRPTLPNFGSAYSRSYQMWRLGRDWKGLQLDRPHARVTRARPLPTLPLFRLPVAGRPSPPAAPGGPRHDRGEDCVVNDIEHADALDWLAAREPGTATAVLYDPPYAVGTPGTRPGGRRRRGRCSARCRSCPQPCRCAPGRCGVGDRGLGDREHSGHITTRPPVQANRWRNEAMAAGDTQITIARIRDLRSHAPIGVAYAECRRRELPYEL